MMELIFKRPESKPPCICIKFDTSYQASTFNQILVDQYKESVFSIKFQLLRGKLDLIISGADKPHKYKDLKFSPDKLNRFLQDTKEADTYNFCHIITTTNKDIVITTLTGRLLWVLKIEGVELIREY
ncbi:MAG: hypothetical protein V4547_00120 [Bacteroidota bacterium]